jgi:NADH-quinone oxidoreductase subunit N
MSTEFLIVMKQELALVLVFFAVLFLKLRDRLESRKLLPIIHLLLLVNLVSGFFFNVPGEVFSGMFRSDAVTILEKNFLNAGLLLVSLQAHSWLKTHRHLAEFYMLLVSSALGMFFMVSSGNFLMFYLGLELASLPLAALVNFDATRRASSEAAMKLILASSFASGIMLFGISLLYGATGSISFAALSEVIDGSTLQVLSLVFIFAGFAFKISAVPFHFWTADVYEGAPVAVTSFLSVISKAAAVFVFISVLTPLFKNFQEGWYVLLAITIVLTISVANLFALRQQNMKRFLAFSSIAQAGYILLGLSSGNGLGITSAIYFLIVYLFSNFAAFGVISVVSAQTGRESVSDYRGLHRSNPIYAWVLVIAMFSLAGIPPTAGFFGKLFLVTAGASTENWGLILFASLNMVISLYYYLRVVKAVFMESSDEPLPRLVGGYPAAAGLLICSVGIVVTGFIGELYTYIGNTFNL